MWQPVFSKDGYNKIPPPYPVCSYSRLPAWRVLSHQNFGKEREKEKERKRREGRGGRNREGDREGGKGGSGREEEGRERGRKEASKLASLKTR